MITFSGYQALRRIYESPSSIIFRARRDEDGLPVILKLLKEAYPSPGEIIRYKQEYQITCSLADVPGVIGVYDLEKHRNTLFMVLEDFGAESLKILADLNAFGLRQTLEVAIEIAGILGDVHAANVIHKDLNPSNVVFNPSTGQIKLIDFGISVVLTSEDPTVKSPDALEATLAYIAPEQTGRMNRSVDYRSDYYSFGVTLYELLTGKLPFEATDAMELVHCHIAKQPIAPDKISPNVPKAVSNVIMKLLSKNAEDRYQSASGIRADLETCLKSLESTGRIEPFDVGRRDIPERFEIPQKLYGRSAETETLMQAFERARAGRKELILVSGVPGIGKTSLVREIYKPVTSHNGYFISGKFDQYQRNVPYLAVVEAFRDLVRQLLTERRSELAAWKGSLLDGLGPNGRVITDVIPEIELIIGPQPPVPDLGPVEARNRFNVVFQDFLRVFCRAERPLVVFLDDLQWADTPSLTLLELMMTDWRTRSLFVIAAYRDNEVGPGHPLMMTLHSMRDRQVIMNQIVLVPLGIEQISELACDTLRRDGESARPLAELVYQKTAGNPFFVKEFLKSLATDGLVEFDHKAGQWTWDLKRIQEQNITDNVVHLMGRRILQLPQETQEVCKLAACLGSQFALDGLAVVRQQTEKEALSALWAGVQSGVILPIGDAYKSIQLDVPESIPASKIEFKFSHDRIQQAAYSLIQEGERPAVHLLVGQLLLRHTPPVQREDKIFDIVNQLNVGIPLIEGQEARYELAELNLLAGSKAKACAAHEPAFNYLSKGISLIGEGGWDRRYELALKLHVQAAEVACLIGDYESLDELAQIVLQRATTLMDRVHVFEIEIQAEAAQNRPKEAVNIALDVLRMLGVDLPRNPNKLQVLLGLARLKLALLGKRIEDLNDLPEMTDPSKRAALKICSRVSNAAYFAAPDLAALLIFKRVELSVRYGNSPDSAIAYAAYGLLLCGALGDIESGYRFGQVALRLLERFGTPEIAGRVLFCVYSLIVHWKEHLRNTLEPLRQAYQKALETGDLEFASISAVLRCHYAMLVGSELSGLSREILSYSEAMRQIKREPERHLNEMMRQVVLNLMGEAENPCRLIGEAYDEEEMVKTHLEASNRTHLCHLYIYKMMLCLLFDEPLEALAHGQTAWQYMDAARSLPSLPGVYYYLSLTRLALLHSGDDGSKRRTLREVAAAQKKMRKWAHHAPMNWLPRFLFVEAERARVTDQEARAIALYDRAIEVAKEHEYLIEESMANEAAAKFYLAKGRIRVARSYMEEARYCYVRWGAKGKVRHLDEKYRELLSATYENEELPSEDARHATTATTGERHPDLDLTAVVNASQAISGEIVLERLIDKLMTLVIKTAGARRGCLILESGGQWLLEAEGSVEQTDITALQGIPVEGCGKLPASIINYVARTQESLVLNDASRQGQYSFDPYVVESRCKSILCAPLIRQSRLMGILYLENNLAEGAFTPARLEILGLLCSQAAISLENARLYEREEDYSRTLESKVAERTQALEQAMQDLRVARDAAETASRAKTEFLTNMSHELRTPLNSIIGFSELLEDQTFGQLNPRQKVFIGNVWASGRHLLELINDLLDLAKVESGKMELQLSTVCIGDLLKGSLAMMRETALKHQLNTQLMIVAGVEGLSLVADGVKLKQIVFNLLSNAVKFTPDGGSIVVAARQEADKLVISVSDTGIGIKAEDQERIFREFEQLDGSNGPKQEGTGLGLALTRRLVELHGGQVWIESDGPGKGSRFSFSIPLIIDNQLE
ncbi:MAG: AAA family ATPase [Desulfomonile tiedjei]|nr:AAA family ATPase [Desulfomonile tiedjei]